VTRGGSVSDDEQLCLFNLYTDSVPTCSNLYTANSCILQTCNFDSVAKKTIFCVGVVTFANSNLDYVSHPTAPRTEPPTTWNVCCLALSFDPLDLKHTSHIMGKAEYHFITLWSVLSSTKHLHKLTTRHAHPPAHN